ncbi:MAG: universal stress protein [Rhodothermales bacterium]|nr:universal stress protein [Rhodothermales bacterium]
MIKRILVALDPDADTPIASRYAIEIAQLHDAEVTGIACIDLEAIGSSTAGGGIGSMYYAERLRERLTKETRARALELIGQFNAALSDAGVRHREEVQEGVPFDRILEDMKYHDLLIIGRDPHFFYGHPNVRTETLVRIVKGTSAPVFIVGNVHLPITRVVIAYDRSVASARAMQRFAQFNPFGKDLEIQVVHVSREREHTESELLLTLATGYLGAHGFRAKGLSIVGDEPKKEILDYAVAFKADLVVAGAHSQHMLQKLAFGSTTESLLEDSPIPLFLES